MPEAVCIGVNGVTSLNQKVCPIYYSYSSSDRDYRAFSPLLALHEFLEPTVMTLYNKILKPKEKRILTSFVFKT